MSAAWLAVPVTLAGISVAQSLDGVKAIFAPGLYETESRSSASPDRGERRTECLRSADVDAFRRETIARFLAAPQFKAVCALSETKPVPGGFAVAMDCDQAKTIITYTFDKDLVRSVTRTQVVPRPDYSSEIVTLSRRIGDCPRR